MSNVPVYTGNFTGVTAFAESTDYQSTTDSPVIRNIGNNLSNSYNIWIETRDLKYYKKK